MSFQLTARDDRLEVRAVAPGGECRAETILPSEATLNLSSEPDPATISSSTLQSVGQRLYQCLMTGDVARLACEVLQDGRQSQQPVHFELRFDADQTLLAQYPWEMIADEQARFLVRAGLVNLTRYITYPQPASALDAVLGDAPLLQIVSQPATLPPLAAVDLAVERLETLPHATFQELERKLLIEGLRLWGLHFDGHGGLAQQCRRCNALHPLGAERCICGEPLAGAKRVGVLAFEQNGGADWRTTEELAQVIYNSPISLAVLMACETARVGDDLIFSGLAPGLVLAGVPAVVGMQYPVPDSFALSFTNSFYAALLSRKDILAAFRTALQMNSRGAWYSPVLYLRQQPGKEEPVRAVYHSRKIDTAAPAEAQAGVRFLARLWIRRPETAPLTQEALREELGVPETTPVRTRTAEAKVRLEEVGIEPVTREMLRRGEVEVALSSPECEILPDSRVLFVDEHLDAPPAIFTVRARTVGPVPLVFSVLQDGGVIAEITQRVEVIGSDRQPRADIDTHSHTVPVQEAVPQVGWTIGRYEILEQMGRGGIGAVYKGYHKSLSRHVAIQVLESEWAQDEQFVARFRAEARAVAMLQHPNILPVHDAAVAQDKCYLVMEYVAGGTLGDQMARGALQIGDAISIAVQLADALAYAHRRGVIHGDLTPDKVLIRRDGRPVLADLGMAKVLGEGGGSGPQRRHRRYAGVHGPGGDPGTAWGRAHGHLCPGDPPVRDARRSRPVSRQDPGGDAAHARPRTASPSAAGQPRRASLAGGGGRQGAGQIAAGAVSDRWRVCRGLASPPCGEGLDAGGEG
jgi:hypothetical protein